jgi:hypothetical protein
MERQRKSKGEIGIDIHFEKGTYGESVDAGGGDEDE